jgi:hypothetical protein
MLPAGFASGLLFIEFLNGEAKHIAGTKEGRSWDFWTQEGFAHTGQTYPERMEIMLVDGKSYPPGVYLLGAGTIKRGGKGGLTVDFANCPLVPLNDAIKGLGDIASAVSAAGAGVAPLRKAS